MRVDSSIPASGLRQLTQQQLAVAAQLRRTDQHVRAHEQAHLAASGGYAKGGPSFTFATGPDGQLYAVGGEVSIDTSPIVGDPKATIQKAETIRAAADAPADPSSQDRAVAAQATQMEIAAQQELSSLQQARANGYGASSAPALGQVISLIG
jgi:SprA-related family